MEVSDQPHTVAVLLLRKEAPVFTGKELGRPLTRSGVAAKSKSLILS